MEKKERTTRSEATAKPKRQKSSLTDSILRLCASGRFGVREAIAAATDRKQPPPREASEASAREQ